MTLSCTSLAYRARLYGKIAVYDMFLDVAFYYQRRNQKKCEQSIRHSLDVDDGYLKKGERGIGEWENREVGSNLQK